MKFLLVGLQTLDFKADNGDAVKGAKLHCLQDADTNDKYMIGQWAKSFFVKESISISGVTVGKPVEIYFNEKGKVDFVKPVA